MNWFRIFGLGLAVGLGGIAGAPAAVTVDFENLPAVTGRPNNFGDAGALQTYISTNLYTITGGVVLSNPLLLANFSVNGTLPNFYGTDDYADASLNTNAITLALPTGATNVQAVLFNGQPQPEDYLVLAWSGPVLLSSNFLAGVPEAFRTSNFRNLTVASTTVNPITQVVVSAPNAASNGWDFGVDTLRLSLLPSLPPYALWRWTNFTVVELGNPAISGDQVSPAGDGIPNVAKYALALDPHVTYSGPLTTGAVQNDLLTLTYRQNKSATDMAYAVEARGDLVMDPWTTNGVSEFSRFDSNSWWNVTAQDSIPVTGGTNRFMHLKISGPQY